MRPYITARCQPFQRIVSLDLGRHSRRGPSPINISNIQRGTGTGSSYLGPRQIQNFQTSFPGSSPGSGHGFTCETRRFFLSNFSHYEIYLCIYFSNRLSNHFFLLFLEIVVFRMLLMVINSYEMNMDLWSLTIVKLFRSRRVRLVIFRIFELSSFKMPSSSI